LIAVSKFIGPDCHFVLSLRKVSLMKLSTWLKSRLFRSQKARRLGRNSYRPRLLEQLEDRSLLAAFHVATTGSDLNPGTTLLPFRTIQAGVNAAALVSDGNDSVNVAGGIYNTVGTDVRFDIPASANLQDLQLLGGWDAGFAVRNPGATPTDYTFTNSPAANRHDVQVLDANTTIDGFTLRSSDGTTPRGADNILVASTDITISNNTLYTGNLRVSGFRASGIVTGGVNNSGLEIVGNAINVDFTGASDTTTAAVGVFLNPSAATTSVLIDGNTISGNNMNSGIIVSGVNNVTVQNNTINRNSPVFGAGIELRNNIASVNNAMVLSNTFSDINTAAANSAGGIVIGGSGGLNAAVTNSTIRSNIISVAGANAQGIFARAGTVAASTLIERNAITAPTAGLTSLSAVPGLDVSGNWFGSANAGDVDTAIGAVPGGTIVARSYLSSGADASAAPGLQLPPATEMLVPQTSATSGLAEVDGRIQSGIDRAVAGMTVRVAADTFAENVIVNKLVTLVGAGSGATTSDTIIDPVSGVGITVTASGSLLSPLSIEDLRVTGATSDGIQITNGADFVTFDNIDSISNTRDGIRILGAGAYQNLKLLSSTLSDNTNSGLSIRSGLTLDGLLVDGSTFAHNDIIGFSTNPSASPGTDITNVTIQNTTFTENGDSSYGQADPPGLANPGLGFGDISFFAMNGNANLTNVQVNGLPTNGAHIGIQFRGSDTVAPAGTIIMTNVTVTGSYVRPVNHPILGGGPGGGLFIQNYTNVSGISMNNVDLLNSEGHQLFAAGLSNMLDVGDTDFGGTLGTGAFHIALGTSTQNPGTGSPVDATGATFGGIAAVSATDTQLFAITDKVLDGVDVGGTLGLVRLKSGNVYVTPNSFLPPVTIAADIQRAVNLASSGDIVNVQSGSYSGNVNTSGESLTLAAGSSPGQVTNGGNLTLDGDDTLAVEVNGSTAGTDYDQWIVNGAVTLDDAELDATGTGATNDGDVLVLIQNDAADPVNGIFDNLPEGSFVVVGGTTYYITYQYNSDAGTIGNDVALIDISGSTTPAPGTIVLVTDPCDPTKMALVVTGTSADDNIDLKLKGSQVEVTIHPKGGSKITQSVPLASITGHIIVYGLAGDDHIEIKDKIGNDAMLFGNEGNDHIKAGDGNSVLVGGIGDDRLQAGKGRDLLIGGDGKDYLQGKDADDILIAGTTDHDNNLAALCAIMDEWTSSNPVGTRRTNLAGLLNSTTVHDDLFEDHLDGHKGADWFFANISGGGVQDKIGGFKASEGDTTTDI
jgi:hypothetical protein